MKLIKKLLLTGLIALFFFATITPSIRNSHTEISIFSEETSDYESETNRIIRPCSINIIKNM